MEGITLATILKVAGAAVTGFSTFQAARANAAVQEMNAEIAEENAQRAITRSQIEQQEQDARTAGLIGEQMSKQAASGLDVGFGSPRYTRIAARELGRLDALNIRQAGELEAYNYRTQAAGGRAQASATRSGGAFGLLSSFLNAGSVITNAKPVANKNYFPSRPVPPQTVLV